MAERSIIRAGSWRGVTILAVAFIAALVATGVTASEEPLPVHATVAAWAEAHPGQPVPLIVQHDGTPEELLTFVRDSGGSVEREFHIVPALDVDMPPGLVDDLARQDDVTWVSLDAPVQSTGDPTDPAGLAAEATVPAAENFTPDPVTAYPFAVKADKVWEQGVHGSGVTVALIDTGVSNDAEEDFYDATGDVRIEWVTTNPDLRADEDGFGHGTHVGGIITGLSTTTYPAGKYTGIAPGANLLAVRIADDEGNATVGDLMAGLEFVDDNRDAYNIRVLNLSVTSSVAQSYTVDPLDAAVELLWFHGVVVVVAAGNDGTAADAVYYPPANDPFVITVGAFDDKGTRGDKDDRLASWSSRGDTQDGFAKPEVAAPGADIVSPVSLSSYLAVTYPEAIVEEEGNTAYFRMSGTSMATGVVSGLAALVREAHPEWTPGELKYVLLETAKPLKGGGERVKADKAVGFLGELESADDGLTPSYLLLAALGVDELDFDGIRWRDADFDGIRWRGLELNGIRWRDVDWSGIRWRGIDFNGIRWRGLDFEGLRWRGIRWRGFVED